MRSALGGVLFIDEAGGLGGSGRENDYLKEAVQTTPANEYRRVQGKDYDHLSRH